MRTPLDSETGESRPIFPVWKGIVWWGMPTAIITAVMRQDREYGTALAGFLTWDFAIQLGLRLLIVGCLGGWAYAKLFRRIARR